MKNHSKLLIATICCLALPSLAEIGVQNVGITNTIAANATTSVNLGNVIKVENQDNVGFMLKFAGSVAGTGAVTVNFARSPDNSNWETTPKVSWVTACNGVTAVVAYTNFPSIIIGAAGYIKVTSIVNADASVNGTNASLWVIKKTIKAAP